MSDEPEWFEKAHGRGGGKRDESAKMIEIAGEVIGASEKALKFYDGSVTVWLPRSQIEETDGGLLVPEWLAKANGLI